MRTNQNSKIDGRFACIWTSEEVSLLQSKWADHSIREIEHLLPRFSPSAIRAKANHLGLKKDFDAKHERGVRNIVPPRAKKVKRPIVRDHTKEVIAYLPEGTKIFHNAKEAALHYGLRTEKIYALIASGDMTWGGMSFDYLF